MGGTVRSNKPFLPVRSGLAHGYSTGQSPDAASDPAPTIPTGAATILVDNETDPPAAVSTIVAPGATVDGGTAELTAGGGVTAADAAGEPLGTLATLFIAPTEPPDPGDIGNLWLQTDPSAVATALTLWCWTGSFWERAGRGDALSGGEWRAAAVDSGGNEIAFLSVWEDVELRSAGGFATVRGQSGVVLRQAGTTKLVTGTLGVHIGTSTSSPAIGSGSADPAAGAGVAAPIGSLYLRTDGTHYAKTGAGDTAWTALATA